MISLFVGVLVATSCTWFVSPRIFRYFDTRCATNHLASLNTSPTVENRQIQLIRNNEPHLSTQVPASSQEAAQLCDALARSSRAGHTANEAVKMHAPQLHHQLFILSHASLDDDSLLLIRSCIVESYFVAAALDHVSVILRENHLFEQRVKTAAAHSLLTIRILSGLPIGALIIALLTQSQLRAQFTTGPILTIFIVGFFLNMAGRTWARALITKTTAVRPLPIVEFTQHLCVSLRAGYSIHEAIIRIEHVNDLSRVIAQQLMLHQPLSQAIDLLRKEGAMGLSLTSILLQASSDGLPIVHTVQQLAIEIRNERRNAMETKTQELPSKLTFPVVFCTLPSFLMLTVMPLILSNLSKLSLPLSTTS